MLNKILLGVIYVASIVTGYFGIKLLAKFFLTMPINPVWLAYILVPVAIIILLASFINMRKNLKE